MAKQPDKGWRDHVLSLLPKMEAAITEQATSFQQATEAEMQPMTLHTNIPSNEATEWLPEKAANRVRALRQSAADLHAVIAPFSEIHEANNSKINAQQRLKHLTDHQQDGGFSLAADDARVIEQEELVSKLSEDFARLNQRNEHRSAAWTSAAQTARAVETWLRDGKPPGTVLEDFDGPEPELLKNEVERLRRRGRELKADLHRIQSAPYPSSHAKAQMRAQVEALAASGAPSVSALVEHDRKIEFATMRVQSSVHNVDAPAVGFAEVPDTLALIAWMNKSALIAALDREIATEADDKASLSHEARQKAEAEVMGDLLDIERQEAALVWRAMDERLPVEHRKECSPQAILQCALVTAPRENVPASSPGKSWLRR